ncbi:MAG TPA: hypothetical protein VH414_13500 [Lichenihabitans sp.]|jgi:hypothetical protein|nr:hypothetical protein [Lichenihabitans sp.]
MHSAWLAVAAVVLPAVLGGCVETMSPVGQAKALDVRAAITRGEMPSPHAATVTLASLEGAPEPLAARFRQDFAGEAAGRQVSLGDPSLAHYFLRGYLDAYPTESGTSVHYVWDLFDASKQRLRRLEEGFELPRAGDGDPWSGVDDAMLASMAARSADDVAVALSGMPEVAGGGPKASVSAAASLPARTVN